jgi:hypothetical protein
MYMYMRVQLTSNRVNAEADVASTLLECLDHGSDVVLCFGNSHAVAGNDDAALSSGEQLRDLATKT